MRFELDHLFVCVERGAPEAERLVHFGLREGPPNEHPGQGTAWRGFSFANSMIELLCVTDAGEAQSENTRRTLLWERWSGRHGGASPFGICVRPAEPEAPDRNRDQKRAELPSTGSPFPAWEYRSAYLPDPLVMLIAEAGVEEPMWVHLDFMRRVDREQRFVEHPIGIRAITGLALTSPVPLCSAASQKLIENGVLSNRSGTAPLLEIEFDGNRQKRTEDFRPLLPF